MSGKTELSLLEKQGWIEPMLRVFLEEHPRLKKAAKQLRNKRAQGESAPAAAPDPAALAAYRQRLDEIIRPGDLVLIHSSMDGLEKLGFSAEDCLAFLKAQVETKACTVVMACFPITNLKPPTGKSRPYDPKKTLCWTGLLPNVFLADPACVRSSFPYNSLAAIGPEAENMMARSLEGESVYHPGSPWRYCYERRAKILFLGVKASVSNTMAIHMVPDLMGAAWPVGDWYELRQYRVRLDEGVITMPVRVQKDFWYRYTMEEGTSGWLKTAGLLTETDFGGCSLGLVPDCRQMLDALIGRCREGKLMYRIPRKYRKAP